MTKNDLLKFCSKPGDFRIPLQSPWSRDDYTYATNSVVIVRVPRLADVEENPKAPKVGFLDTLPEPEQWYTIPPFVLPDAEKCDDCGGDGVCACCGDGECARCDGEGKVISVRDHAMVGPARLGCVYLALLKTLPGCLLGPTGAFTPCRVKFDGGDGAIMPRRP